MVSYIRLQLSAASSTTLPIKFDIPRPRRRPETIPASSSVRRAELPQVPSYDTLFTYIAIIRIAVSSASLKVICAFGTATFAEMFGSDRSSGLNSFTTAPRLAHFCLAGSESQRAFFISFETFLTKATYPSLDISAI